jgi:hypothetical protein
MGQALVGDVDLTKLRDS